jgi:hypothetical protein
MAADIDGCRVDASLLLRTAQGWVSNRVGGIVGENVQYGSASIIRNSSFKGSLGATEAGGILARNSNYLCEITGCTADFTLIDEGMSCYGSGIYVGGITGAITSPAKLENCFASADLSLSAMTNPNATAWDIFIGGLVGYAWPSNTTVQHCVSMGKVYTSRDSGYSVCFGGIAGRYYDPATTIKNCVSLFDVAKPSGAFTENFAANISSAESPSANFSNITNCLWLADSTIIPAVLTSAGTAYSFPADQNIRRVSDASALPATAAILTPSYAALRMGGSPIEFAVKTYPEESAGNVVTGLWTFSGGAVSLTETGLAHASVSPVSAGDATVTFHVANTGNPNTSLFGGYAPSLSARVAVLEALPVPPVPDSDKSISEIWTEISGVKHVANGDGVILLPEGTAVTALPIWIAAASDKAAVSPPASGDAYDFTNSRVFTVTAEDETSAQYTVSVWVEESLVIGDIVDADDAGSWEAEALVRKDDSVKVSLWMPMSIDPALIGSIENVAAETSGFVPGSVTFAIVQGDKVIKNFSLGAGGAGAAGDDSQPYTLLFSGTCAGEADYASAAIGQVLYRISGVTYEQDLGVTVSTDTDVTLTREEKDDEPDGPTPPVDPGDGNNDGGSGSGCDAGTAPLAALGAAASASALPWRKKI